MTALKLDLGAGAASPPGFIPLGRRHGTEIYPLPYADGTVSEIRAAHVLEHFPHRQVPEVLADWARALAPGGELRIAVPDFAAVAQRYLEGAQEPTEGYVMGGQTDGDDFHRALFDERRLAGLLAGAGLVLIRPWRSELEDCAALPISLNLGGTKPHQAQLGVSACMSLPRVTWTANAMSAIEALPPLNVKLRCFTGAFWAQCLERCIEQALAEDEPDAILTLDYDTVFRRKDVATLMGLMMVHPEAHAITAVQAMRGRDVPLFTKRDAAGGNATTVASSEFAPDLQPIATAHFGLTLIRADRLRALPKPWLRDVPSPDGDWSDGRTDADIAFWRKWEAAGHTLMLANRVTVGHLDLMVRWPGRDLAPIHQSHRDWRKSGAPEGVWK